MPHCTPSSNSTVPKTVDSWDTYVYYHIYAFEDSVYDRNEDLVYDKKLRISLSCTFSQHIFTA